MWAGSLLPCLAPNWNVLWNAFHKIGNASWNNVKNVGVAGFLLSFWRVLLSFRSPITYEKYWSLSASLLEWTAYYHSTSSQKLPNPLL